MCRVVSWVVGAGCLLWPVCSLDKSLLSFALLHFVLQSQIYLLLQVSFDFLILHFNPLWWKEHFFFFLVFVLEHLVGHHRAVPFNFSLFGISVWGIDLYYSDVEWFALEMNQDHSVIFEIVPKYHISDSFVDYMGYSIHSKEFLPIVVDIIVTWIKIAYSHPF